MSDHRSELRAVIDAYQKGRNVGTNAISMQLFRKGTRLDEYLDGKVDIGTTTYERAMEWLSDHWPEKSKWPTKVERPSSRRPFRQASHQAEAC